MLGAVLCLLAAAFATEAKLGGYSPNGNVRVEFTSTKLQTGDISKQIVQAVTTPVSHSQFPAELPFFLALAAVILTISVFKPAYAIPRLASPSLLPPHFFRPPPPR